MPGLIDIRMPFGSCLTPQGSDLLTDLDASVLRRTVLASRLLVLRGFRPLSNEDFTTWCRQWGELLEWDFGVLLDVRVDQSAHNYLFTSQAVPLHWDGAFARQAPSFQIFQCVKATEAGGETVFVDTVSAWLESMPSQKARWQTLTIRYRTDKAAHYGGEITVPLVGRHPHTGETVLRWAEPHSPDVPVLNPVHSDVLGMDPIQAGALAGELRSVLYRTGYCYQHRWETGDYVIADNHALLHGRRPFQDGSPRHLQRIQVL